MITPSRQSNPSATSQPPPGKSKDSASFHGFSISQLPADVLPGITCYLSMCEVLALGQVCRGLRSNLQRCGVITDICNYLSLPKGIKWSIHYFVTGNRLLIDHLRKNPAAYNKSFAIQHSPAIYRKYASYFRECMVRASSVTLVSSGHIDGPCNETSYKLNSQHNCLIQECNDTNLLHVWTNQKDGSWKCEHTADTDLWSYEIDRIQHGAQTLFIDGGWDESTHLRFVERNELGKWNETKRLYPAAIVGTTEDLFIHQVDLANNQRVMLCLLDHYLSTKSALLIVGLDADGRWQTKGKFQFCGKIVPDLARFRFSHDCRHVAGFTTNLILFVSEQDDGTWVETGKIEPEGKFSIESLKFSTDDRHSVLCGKDTGSDDVLPWRNDFCVIVVSQDEHGHWSEAQRIYRSCGSSTGAHPHAKFSVDSKQLFVSINRQLIILSLHEGKWVSSTHPPKLRDADGKIKTSMDPSSFMVIADKTACFFAIDASGVWSKQREFFCYRNLPPTISPEGDTVVCLYEHDWQIEIWTRRHSDQWIKQEFSISAYRAEFSPDGSLLALASYDSLTLLGRTEKTEWQKKAEQRMGGPVMDLSFSPCGRSIRVDYEERGNAVVSFWQIVPQALRDEVRGEMYP